MDYGKKRISFHNIIITFLLIVVLIVIILFGISIFISGPAIHYESKINHEIKRIQQKHSNIKNISRHIFQYIVYIGEDDNLIYWFNEKGEILYQIEKQKIPIEEAKQKIKDLYALENFKISYGYGKDKPVFIIENEEIEIYLDINTLDVVYYRKKGF